MKKSGSALSRGPTTQTYDFNPSLGGPKPPKPKPAINTKPFDNIKPFDTTKNRRATETSVRTNTGSQYSQNNYKPITNSRIGNASNKPQSRTAGSKYGGSEILDPATSEMQDELADVWKVFGRDTEAGRALWRTYASGHKKQINYPGLKTKPWDPREALKIESKPCPQQTIIEYPPVFTKAGLTRAKMMSNIHKIDLIQHRKPRDQILTELRKYYSIVEIPVNRAVNREKMISDLQEKFKYSKPSRPHDNPHPKKYFFSQSSIKISSIELDLDEEDKIQHAVDAIMRKELAKGYFGSEKPPADMQPKPQAELDCDSQIAALKEQEKVMCKD
jgi:hypothetical protein